MSNCNRVHAVNVIAGRKAPEMMEIGTASLASYGEDVFNREAILKYLPESTAEKLLATIAGDEPFDPGIAGDVANAMKQWAISRGATHYTHWFRR